MSLYMSGVRDSLCISCAPVESESVTILVTTVIGGVPILIDGEDPGDFFLFYMQFQTKEELTLCY